MPGRVHLSAVSAAIMWPNRSQELDGHTARDAMFYIALSLCRSLRSAKRVPAPVIRKSRQRADGAGEKQQDQRIEADCVGVEKVRD